MVLDIGTLTKWQLEGKMTFQSRLFKVIGRCLKNNSSLIKRRRMANYWCWRSTRSCFKAAEHKVTKDALIYRDRLFQHFKDYEKLMEKQLEAAGQSLILIGLHSQMIDKTHQHLKNQILKNFPEKPKTTEEVNKNAYFLLNTMLQHSDSWYSC